MKLTMLYRTLIFIVLFCLAIPTHAGQTILILGDSLSAGHGIQADRQWASLLVTKLQESNFDYTVVNASVSGAATSDGLRRLPQLLIAYKPQIFILALGSNDGLRNIPIATIRTNLSKLITLAKAANAQILLVGFKLPITHRSVYRKQFEEIFPELSKEYSVPLVPFLLDGFATDATYFQEDKLHPTIGAQIKMLNNVWQYLEPMLLLPPQPN